MFKTDHFFYLYSLGVVTHTYKTQFKLGNLRNKVFTKLLVMQRSSSTGLGPRRGNNPQGREQKAASDYFKTLN